MAIYGFGMFPEERAIISLINVYKMTYNSDFKYNYICLVNVFIFIFNVVHWREFQFIIFLN
jgi:hypothetical protein